jgi:hypothetical protein
MIACVGRVLRLSLAVALVSMLGFAATNAQAFVDESLVCADPNSLFLNFDDDENWADFDAVSNCTKICKSYVNKCKSDVKSNHSCIKKAIGDNAELERKAFCDTQELKEDKKACKEDVNADEKADKDDAKSQREIFLTACDDIQDDCVSSCED